MADKTNSVVLESTHRWCVTLQYYGIAAIIIFESVDPRMLHVCSSTPSSMDINDDDDDDGAHHIHRMDPL